MRIKDPQVAVATPETRATCERLLRRNVTTKVVCAIFKLAAADSDDRAQPFRHDGAQRSEMIAISGGHPVDMDLVSVS